VSEADGSSTQDVPRSDKLDNKLSDKPAYTNPELAAVVEAWPALPEAVRSAVLTLVRASGS
jgi:hypothetical protein